LEVEKASAKNGLLHDRYVSRKACETVTKPKRLTAMNVAGRKNIVIITMAFITILSGADTTAMVLETCAISRDAFAACQAK
jgi:hypothetical protein